MRLLAIVLLSISPTWAQKTISVSNAASGSSQIAPGSLLKILWSAPNGIGTPDPPVASVRLQLRDSNQLFNALVLSSLASGQILAVVPEDMPLGTANLTLVLNSTVLPPVPVSVVPLSFGVFTVSGIGIGPALAQNNSGAVLPALNALTTPALPGRYVTLWGTGLGDFKTPDVTISIAGEMVSPSFAGRAPSLPGIDQINFQVPADAPYGCYIPVTVSAGNSTSNEVTIAVAPATGACTHPLGLSAQELQTLDQGGTILTGSMRFNSGIYSPNPSAISYTRQESFGADFLPEDAFGIFLLSPVTQPDSSNSVCSLQKTLYAGINRFIDISRLQDVAGPSLSLVDPSNQTSGVPSQARSGGFGGGAPLAQGVYSLVLSSPPAVATAAQLPHPFFVPGTWQVIAPGGDTISAFQQMYRLPPQIRWTNRESLTSFSRDTDVPITWDPQGYSPNDRMVAFLFTGDAAYISCTAPAQSGQIVLPAALLQQIGPTAPSVFSPLPIGSLELIFEPQIPTLFRLALKAGGSAPAIINYVFSDALRPVVQ